MKYPSQKIVASYDLVYLYEWQLSLVVNPVILRLVTGVGNAARRTSLATLTTWN